MRHSRHGVLAVVTTLGLWVCLVLALEVGRRIGLGRLGAASEESRSGIGVVDGAVFGLLGLLLGFSFNGAAARFDKRRELVAEEANTMGTAWQRVDVLGADQQPQIRRLFREYLDALLASYRERPDSDDLTRHPASVTRAQDALWLAAVAECLTRRGEQARMLLLPALNDAFGAVDRERMARKIHPPKLIVGTLGLSAIGAAVFAGYALANAGRNWIYIVSVATSIAVATFVIFELEYPRLGLLRLDAMDRELADLRESMNDSGQSRLEVTNTPDGLARPA